MFTRKNEALVATSAIVSLIILSHGRSQFGVAFIDVCHGSSPNCSSFEPLAVKNVAPSQELLLVVRFFVPRIDLKSHYGNDQWIEFTVVSSVKYQIMRLMLLLPDRPSTLRELCCPERIDVFRLRCT